MATVGSVTAGVVFASVRSSTSAMRHLWLIPEHQIVCVPLDGFFQSFHDPNRGAVAEQALGLRDVGARELQVAAPRLAMDRLGVPGGGVAPADAVADQIEQLDERGLVAERDVVGLAERH